MRAKFIRGKDPKAAVGLGVDGEILQIGRFEKFNTGYAPVMIPINMGHDLLSNWEEEIDGNYIFKYHAKGYEHPGDADPEQLAGKTVIFDGKIYSIPSGAIPGP